jgi:hypothetical protein
MNKSDVKKLLEGDTVLSNEEFEKLLNTKMRLNILKWKKGPSLSPGVYLWRYSMQTKPIRVDVRGLDDYSKPVKGGLWHGPIDHLVEEEPGKDPGPDEKKLAS